MMLKVELALADSLQLDVLAAYIMKPKEGLIQIIKNGKCVLVAHLKPKVELVCADSLSMSWSPTS